MRDVSAVDLDHVRCLVAEHLVGRIEQVPPMVSAVRVGGRRLHELAREGVEVARAARTVTIDRFDVVAVTGEPGGRPVLAVEVDCSAGTYVRVLAADLGALLGTGAHLRNLRRTAVWPFTLDEASAPDDCELLPLAAAVRALETVQIDDATAARIAVGAMLPAPPGDGPWAMFTEGGDLLAVYEAFDGDRAKPAVVLPLA